MGQEILYCHSCGTKLLSDDFTRGRAHTFNNRQFCKTCVPTGMSPAMIPPPKPSPRPSTQRIQKEHRTPVRPITRVSAPPARRSSALLFFGLGIVVALGAAVGVLYALGAFNGVAPAPETPAPAPKPPEPRPDPTKAARQKEQFAAELKDLESKAKPSLDREQFSAVLDLFEEARKRHDVPDWDAVLLKRIQEIKAIPAALYPSIKSKACAAQLIGARTDVEPLRARVAGWGLKEWIDDLNKALAAIVPREPLPAGVTVLFNFPEALALKTRVLGNRTESGLNGRGEKDSRVLGWELGGELFKIPEAGEARLTFSTDKPAQILFTCRGSASPGAPNLAYNFTIKNPEVGRPQTIKIPLRALSDYEKNEVRAGMPVENVYVRQYDPVATLTVYSLVVFRSKP